MTRTSLLLAFAALAAPVVAADEATERLRDHVAYLASPDLEGRLTGTPGARKAADYIVERLQGIGARPLPGQDDYRLGMIVKSLEKLTAVQGTLDEYQQIAEHELPMTVPMLQKIKMLLVQARAGVTLSE